MYTIILSLYISVILTLYVTYNSDADIDECSTNSHSCNINAMCSNTVGSYACAVKQDSRAMEKHALVSGCRVVKNASKMMNVPVYMFY